MFFFREIPLPQYLHLQEFVQEICLYQQAYLQKLEVYKLTK